MDSITRTLVSLFKRDIEDARSTLPAWPITPVMHGIDQDIMYSQPDSLDRFDGGLLGALVERMRDVSAEHGAKFILYHHPDIGAIWDPYIRGSEEKLGVAPEQWDRLAFERRLAAVAGDHGVAFLPVVDYFAANQERGPFHLLPRDFHCNSTGYQLTAELIADRLIETRALPGS